MDAPKTTTTLAQAMTALQQIAAQAREALLTIRGESRNCLRVLDRERSELGPCDAGSDRERILDIYAQVMLETELTADCNVELHWARSLENREHLVRDAERHVLAYLGDLKKWRKSREQKDMQQAIDDDDINDMRVTRALEQAQEAVDASDEGYDPYENRYTEDC